jgi:hypothetical protein
MRNHRPHVIGGIKEKRSDHGTPKGLRNLPLRENRQGIMGRAQRIKKYRTTGTIMQVRKRIRKKRNKAAEEGKEESGTPDGHEGNITNGGIRGLTADHFNILLSLRIARPPDNSPTKVIAYFFQTLQKAEPKAHIPPQMKWAEDMATLAQPSEVPDRHRLRLYFTETSKSQKDQGGTQEYTLVGTIRVLLPYPFARLCLNAEYLRTHSVKESKVQEDHLRRIGVILNSC